MLLDTGAEISVVDSILVSEEHYLNRKMAVRGLGPTVLDFDMAQIHLELGDRCIDLVAVVAPPGTLPYPAIFSRDVPGMELTMKLEEAEVLPVMTRAAKKRKEEQQALDDRATEESAADPVPLESIPDSDDGTQGEDVSSVEQCDHEDAELEGMIPHLASELATREEPDVGWLPTHLDMIVEDICRTNKVTYIHTSPGKILLCTNRKTLHFNRLLTRLEEARNHSNL